jgi:glycosyltransferase involved in cell wall biosynthesis
MVRDIVMAGSVAEADIVHCHLVLAPGRVPAETAAWCSSSVDHALLEPHRPWKVEQLGTAYHASSWVERTAYQNADGIIAVSEAMRRDVHASMMSRLKRFASSIMVSMCSNTNPRRIPPSCNLTTSIKHSLRVVRRPHHPAEGHYAFDQCHQISAPRVQVVLCAGAPDTPALGEEMATRVEQAGHEGSNRIIWVPQMVPRKDVIVLYTHASIFVCPSVYEPFGIINLEAMACETPVVAAAVGASRSGGARETGLLVPFEPVSCRTLSHGTRTILERSCLGGEQPVDDPATMRAMGRSARTCRALF